MSGFRSKADFALAIGKIRLWTLSGSRKLHQVRLRGYSMVPQLSPQEMLYDLGNSIRVVSEWPVPAAG
jgi:hypothetical protein